MVSQSMESFRKLCDQWMMGLRKERVERTSLVSFHFEYYALVCCKEPCLWQMGKFSNCSSTNLLNIIFFSLLTYREKKKENIFLFHYW